MRMYAPYAERIIQKQRAAAALLLMNRQLLVGTKRFTLKPCHVKD